MPIPIIAKVISGFLPAIFTRKKSPLPKIGSPRNPNPLRLGELASSLYPIFGGNGVNKTPFKETNNFVPQVSQRDKASLDAQNQSREDRIRSFRG